MIDFLLERFAGAADREGLVWRDRPTTYAWLLTALAAWREVLDRHGIAAGAVVVLRGDFSPQSLAAFLVLGPWLGSRILKAQENADSVAYAVGSARVMMIHVEKAFEISQEDLEIALWALQQRRRHKRK